MYSTGLGISPKSDKSVFSRETLNVVQCFPMAPSPALPATPPYRAILLLGPTGSGKTPLGELLQQRGLWGHGCQHFDFGANLREIVAQNRPDERISASDIQFLGNVLQSGALLEDEHFPLARRILDRFITARLLDRPDWLVLNGLPRHAGQAKALEDILRVEVVIRLDCAPEAVMDRIRRNSGGDRTDRTDDAPHDVARKLAIFSARTVPLMNYYQQLGARVEIIPVTPETGPEEIVRGLEASHPQG